MGNCLDSVDSETITHQEQHQKQNDSGVLQKEREQEQLQQQEQQQQRQEQYQLQQQQQREQYEKEQHEQREKREREQHEQRRKQQSDSILANETYQREQRIFRQESSEIDRILTQEQESWEKFQELVSVPTIIPTSHKKYKAEDNDDDDDNYKNCSGILPYQFSEELERPRLLNRDNIIRSVNIEQPSQKGSTICAWGLSVDAKEELLCVCYGNGGHNHDNGGENDDNQAELVFVETEKFTVIGRYFLNIYNCYGVHCCFSSLENDNLLAVGGGKEMIKLFTFDRIYSQSNNSNSGSNNKKLIGVENIKLKQNLEVNVLCRQNLFFTTPSRKFLFASGYTNEFSVFYEEEEENKKWKSVEPFKEQKSWRHSGSNKNNYAPFILPVNSYFCSIKWIGDDTEMPLYQSNTNNNSNGRVEERKKRTVRTFSSISDQFQSKKVVNLLCTTSKGVCFCSLQKVPKQEEEQQQQQNASSHATATSSSSGGGGGGGGNLKNHHLETLVEFSFSTIDNDGTNTVDLSSDGKFVVVMDALASRTFIIDRYEGTLLHELNPIPFPNRQNIFHTVSFGESYNNNSAVSSNSNSNGNGFADSVIVQCSRDGYLRTFVKYNNNNSNFSGDLFKKKIKTGCLTELHNTETYLQYGQAVNINNEIDPEVLEQRKKITPHSKDFGILYFTQLRKRGIVVASCTDNACRIYQVPLLEQRFERRKIVFQISMLSSDDLKLKSCFELSYVIRRNVAYYL